MYPPNWRDYTMRRTTNCSAAGRAVRQKRFAATSAARLPQSHANSPAPSRAADFARLVKWKRKVASQAPKSHKPTTAAKPVMIANSKRKFDTGHSDFRVSAALPSFFDRRQRPGRFNSFRCQPTRGKDSHLPKPFQARNPGFCHSARLFIRPRCGVAYRPGSSRSSIPQFVSARQVSYRLIVPPIRSTKG